MFVPSELLQLQELDRDSVSHVDPYLFGSVDQVP